MAEFALYYGGMHGEIDSIPFYARVIGTIEMFCPQCGSLILLRTGPKGPWIARCGRRSCRRHITVGIVGRWTERGRKSPPPDRTFPPAAWAMRIWENASRVNLFDHHNKLLPDEFEPSDRPATIVLAERDPELTTT